SSEGYKGGLYFNLRLNVSYKTRSEVDAFDLFLLMGRRQSSFVKLNLGIFKDCLRDIYSEHITSSGGWLKFMESIGTGLRPEAHYLFLGAPISERPNLELGLYSYSKNLNKYEPFIELARDAENRAREQLGVPLIGE